MQMDFGRELRLVRYVIRNRGVGSGGGAPRDYTLQGSKDGVAWDVIDTVVDAPNPTWAGHAVQADFAVDPVESYRLYRIVVIRIWPQASSVNYVSIGDMEFYTDTFYVMPNIPNSNGLRHYMKIL